MIIHLNYYFTLREFKRSEL